MLRDLASAVAAIVVGLLLLVLGFVDARRQLERDDLSLPATFTPATSPLTPSPARVWVSLQGDQ